MQSDVGVPTSTPTLSTRTAIQYLRRYLEVFLLEYRNGSGFCLCSPGRSTRGGEGLVSQSSARLPPRFCDRVQSFRMQLIRPNNISVVSIPGVKVPLHRCMHGCSCIDSGMSLPAQGDGLVPSSEQSGPSVLYDRSLVHPSTEHNVHFEVLAKSWSSPSRAGHIKDHGMRTFGI